MCHPRDCFINSQSTRAFWSEQYILTWTTFILIFTYGKISPNLDKCRFWPRFELTEDIRDGHHMFLQLILKKLRNFLLPSRVTWGIVDYTNIDYIFINGSKLPCYLYEGNIIKDTIVFKILYTFFRLMKWMKIIDYLHNESNSRNK